jgi:hypothetical protein
MQYVTFRHFFLIIAALFLFLGSSLNAQENKQIPLIKKRDTLSIHIRDTITRKTTVPQTDLPEALRSLFNKRPAPASEQFIITSKPIYSVVPAIGYTLQTKLAAVLSGNAVFYTDTSARLSAITANATYTQNKQFYIHAQPNIWIKNNRYNFVGDIRFYKYPQSTFGLGSGSPRENENPMSYSFLRLYQVVLKQIKNNFFAGIGYIMDYRWNISEEGTLNGTKSDFRKYGAPSTTISSGATLNALFDTRDNSINSAKGFYTSMQLRNNLKALGSNSNWQSLILDVRKYIQLPAKSDNVLAFWSYNWLILSGKPPYLDLPSNGWDSYSSTGRGYIQGRFRGAQMVYLETEYRFKISANGLFGGVLYANVESFSAAPGTLLQQAQPGFGPGLRIKLNKKSKTNIGIDYAFGTEGSRGLFITVGELF